MDNPVLVKVPEAARIVNISRMQAYRMLPTWEREGIAIRMGQRTVRINRRKLLEWAGEKTEQAA